MGIPGVTQGYPQVGADSAFVIVFYNSFQDFVQGVADNLSIGVADNLSIGVLYIHIYIFVCIR